MLLKRSIVKFGRVVGNLVLSNAVSNLYMERLLLISSSGNVLDVAIDRLGAKLGDTVLCSQSKEASFALGFENCPTDLAIIAIIDS